MDVIEITVSDVFVRKLCRRNVYSELTYELAQLGQRFHAEIKFNVETAVSDGLDSEGEDLIDTSSDESDLVR